MAASDFNVRVSDYFNGNLVVVDRVTKGVMGLEYGLFLIAFLCLFIAFMRVLKRSFEHKYDKIKVCASIAFTAFILLLIFRYAVYILIQFST